MAPSEYNVTRNTLLKHPPENRQLGGNCFIFSVACWYLNPMFLITRVLIQWVATNTTRQRSYIFCEPPLLVFRIVEWLEPGYRSLNTVPQKASVQPYPLFVNALNKEYTKRQMQNPQKSNRKKLCSQKQTKTKK